MEALAITPVKASALPAKQHAQQGLGDLFQVFLNEATLRVDVRPATQPAFPSQRATSEPGRRFDPGFNSSIERSHESRTHDPDGPSSEPRPDALPEPNRPIMHEDERDRERGHGADGAATAPATEDSHDPESRGQAPDDIDNKPQQVAGKSPEAAPEEVPVEDSDTAPALETTGLPVQAQDFAAAIASTKAQALGKGEPGLQAPARTTPPLHGTANPAPQAPPPGSSAPVETVPAGPNGAAALVQITPVPVVAPPNATLGGGAAVAALAAEAAQPAAQSAQTAQATAGASSAAATGQAAAAAPLTATVTQPQPRAANRPGQSGAATDNRTVAGTTTAIAPNAQGADVSVRGASAPSAPAQTAPVQPTTTAEAAEPSFGAKPQNAQTPFADARNGQAANIEAQSGLTSNGRTPDAATQNALAQNARTEGAQTQTAQSLGAPTPSGTGSEGSAGTSTTGGASQSPLPNEVQPARNTAAQASVQQAGQAATAAAATGQAATSANAMERSMAPANLQRAEGSGPVTAAPAGAIGLTQAAARTPFTLPAQARPASMPSVPVNQVAVHIQRAATAGQDRIRIQLHPAELGQVEVKLNVGSDGAVKAIVSVERPETFELLQRDARGLEKALNDAGLKTDSGSLNFNLKGEAENGAHAEQDRDSFDRRDSGTAPEDEPEVEVNNLAANAQAGASRALDMRV